LIEILDHTAKTAEDPKLGDNMASILCEPETVEQSPWCVCN